MEKDELGIADYILLEHLMEEIDQLEKTTQKIWKQHVERI